MLRFKQYLIEDNVRPSKLSNDPAFRIGDLSNEFAAFPPDQHGADFLQSYSEQLAKNSQNPKYAGMFKEYMSIFDDARFTPDEKLKQAVNFAVNHVEKEKRLLNDPASVIRDATAPKFRSFGKQPSNLEELGKLFKQKTDLYDKHGLAGVSVTNLFQGSYMDKPTKLPKNATATEIVPDKSKVPAVAKGAKVAKPIAAAALKALPVIGTAASVAAMANRAQAGDYVGAGLEAASEVADYIPGVGTAASMGIQGYLADRDMSDEERKEAEKKAARQALRSMNVHSPRY